MNLSKKETTTINYQVNYKDLPQNRVFEKEPIKEIPLKVNGTGFKLISANFSKKSIDLKADKLKVKRTGETYLLPNQQLKFIENQLYSGLKLQSSSYDTIYLQLGLLSSKKVPVLADSKINFDLGYDLANPIKFSPDSVLVSGPDLQLSTINSIKTKEILFENLATSKKFRSTLVLPSNNDKLKISHDFVDVEIEVDKFTEGEFLVPFEIENLPYGTKINTFPKKVKLIYKVGLSNFNKISPELFKVVCDYRASKENDLSYLIPKIETSPSLVKSARVTPNKIDFLIQQ